MIGVNMGNQILNYVTHNSVVLWILLAVIILAVFFWCLYRREKYRAVKAVKAIEEERRFHENFSKTQECCYLYVRQSDLKVMFASSNFGATTGLSREVLLTDLNVLTELVSQSDARAFLKAFRAWDRTKPFEWNLPYHRMGQTEVHRARICVWALNDQDEDVYLAVLHDITEAYDEYERQQEELVVIRKESKEKTDFLSKMSHEIRTPINGILGMLSLARINIDDKAATADYLERTENLSQFLLQLINDILDISRIESGKMQLAQEKFSIRKLGEKLDTMFRGTSEGKGIHWNVELQDFSVKYVIGDEMRLSQIIVNFVSNAVKFTPAGGSVTVTFRQMDVLDDMLHLLVRVKDTGKGIKEDFIEKIFRPFEQEDASTAKNYGGSGLGMAIADNMVKLMNGQILVDSQEGKGTEFSVYLTLPVAEYDEGMQPQEIVSPTEALSVEAAKEKEKQKEVEKQKKEALEHFTLDGIHILLAEDNDINAEIAIELLKLQGAVLERACDGADAVQKFKDSQPGTFDVILMDIQMPQLDGWEATKVIRNMDREDAQLPIFAMSANAFVEDQRHSLEVGMNGHINKPVDFEEVRKAIGSFFYDNDNQR